MPTAHPLEECPHNPTFEHISQTLTRLDNHTERTAIAMETVARQGAIVENHEKRLCTHDKDLREVFGRVRKVEEFQAREVGALSVEEKSSQFWDGIKQQLVPYVIGAAFLVFWLMDKYNVPQHLASWWKELHS